MDIFVKCNFNPKEVQMNKDSIKGNWNELKGIIQQKWAKLTDDDVSSLKGNANEFVGKLQKLYGYSKERAEEEVKNFRQKYNEIFGDSSTKSTNATENRKHGFANETATADSSPLTGTRSAKDQGSPDRDMDSDVSGFAHTSGSSERRFGSSNLDEDQTEVNESSTRAKRSGDDDMRRGVTH